MQGDEKNLANMDSNKDYKDKKDWKVSPGHVYLRLGFQENVSVIG